MRRMHPATTCAMIAALAGSASAANFPAVTRLSVLDGAIGFTLHGEDPGDSSGWAVGSAGDLNGDGVDDIVIGARLAHPGGRTGAGAVYVVFGRDTGAVGPFPSLIELSTLSGADGFVLYGESPYDESGFSVARAGDVNGDGVDDLVIGARDASPGGRNYAGAAYVVFGKKTSVAGAFPASVELASLDGSTGFRLDGEAPYDYSGFAVAAAGDINHDGVADVVIGAAGASPGGRPIAGAAYVVFGKKTGVVGAFPASIELSSLDGSNGLRLEGAEAYDDTGAAVAFAGDINHDGVDDLILGAPYADPGGRTLAGVSYVVYGKNVGSGGGAAGAFPASIDLSTLDGESGFRLEGVGFYDESGRSAASAGDLNGDGVDDLAIGAFGATPGERLYSGATYVVFGKDTSVAGAFPASFALSSIDGANGFRLEGASNYDESGFSVASAGDVNGDGLPDLCIGARFASPEGHISAGAAFVVFGRNAGVAGAFPASFDLGDLDGVSGFRLEGIDPSDFGGWSVASAGDVNGDGVNDVIIGAPYADPGGSSMAGSTYVLFGRDTVPPPCPGDANGDRVVSFIDLNILLTQFGSSGPALTGDLNHDGVVDFFDLNILLTNFGTAC